MEQAEHSLPFRQDSSTEETNSPFHGRKTGKVDGNFFTFAVGKDSNKYLFMRQKSGSIKSVITSGSWSAEQGVDQSVDQTLLNEWQNITIVKEAGKMSVEGKEYIVQDGDIMHFRFNV